MDIPSIKISISIQTLKWIQSFGLKIRNLLTRPKLKVEFKPHVIEMLLDNKPAHAWCVAIILTSTKDIKIKANSIKLNNENYTALSQGFAGIASKEHNSEVLSYFKDNWLDITQGIKYIDVKKYEPLILPLSMVGSYSSFLATPPKVPFLFNSAKKLSIYLNIDDKTSCYGLDLITVQSKVINHLAFRLKEMKTLKEPYKELIT